MLRSASRVLLGLLVVSSSACVIADDVEEPVVSEDFGLFLEGARWPGGWVPVCYNATTAARADFAALSARVRRAAEGSWQRVANVNFTGWGTCGTNTNGWVVINFTNTTAANAEVGYDANTPQAMNLGVNRTDWDAVAIHEFGHILGFGHEMRRGDFSDVTGTGCAEANPGGGDTLGTDPDNQSIMAATGYCQNNTTLSPWDIAGVQVAYGRKPGGSIVDVAGGRCLNVEGGVTTLGARLIAWPCVGGQNDVWSYNTPSRILSVGINNVLRCAAVKGGVTSTTQSTPLVSWSCDTTANHFKFQFTGVLWRAMGDMCVVAKTATVGSTLEIQPCGTRANERWDVRNGDQRIRLTGTSLCVEVPSGAATLGNALKLKACGIPATTRENLTFARGGQIFYQGLCATVMGGKPTAGAQIALWDGCTQVPAMGQQVFHWTGTIKSMSQCVELVGGASANGTAVGVATCAAGAARQQWDVWF